MRARLLERAIVVALAALTVAVGIAVPARVFSAHREARMYVITTWTSACSGSTRSPWDNMVDAWYDEIAAHGWQKTQSMVNGTFTPEFFTDPDTGLSPAWDHLNIDGGDAAMIGLHGSDNGDRWRGQTRGTGGHPDCSIHAPNAAGGDLFVGDYDLEFLHLSSCNSMDDDNLSNTWRMFFDPIDTPNNGRRLHQANGFHGVMYIYSNWPQYYEDFADDAFDVSIKDSWMDNHPLSSPGGTDQCPISYAIGASVNDCFNRIDNERYNNVFSDPSAASVYCYYYYRNCDPAGDGPFVDPNA